VTLRSIGRRALAARLVERVVRSTGSGLLDPYRRYLSAHGAVNAHSGDFAHYPRIAAAVQLAKYLGAAGAAVCSTNAVELAGRWARGK
jgi:hypothetical protein